MNKLYKIDDCLSFDFLRLPKALFANPIYKAMSSDAKLTYSLLFDRLSLSMQNNWINEKDEVFLIYTREELSEELGITYKKAMAAFRELLENGLIFEKRCGRGMANKIFIVKPELTAKQAKEYNADCQPEPSSRTAEMEVQEELRSTNDSDKSTTVPFFDIPKQQFKNGNFGSSKTAKTEVQELPNREPIKTDYNHSDYNQTYFSQSVVGVQSTKSIVQRSGTYNQPDDKKLQDILENCQLAFFDKETQITFRDAIERLFYCQQFKIGNAILPGDNVRSHLNKLNYTHLESAQHNLYQNKARPVKNITAYVMSTIFNCIAEEYSMLLVDPYLNCMRA